MNFAQLFVFFLAKLFQLLFQFRVFIFHRLLLQNLVHRGRSEGFVFQTVGRRVLFSPDGQAGAAVCPLRSNDRRAILRVSVLPGGFAPSSDEVQLVPGGTGGLRRAGRPHGRLRLALVVRLAGLQVVRQDGQLLVSPLQLALVLDGVRQGVRQVGEGVRNVVLHLYEDEEVWKVERLAGLVEERDVAIAGTETDYGQHSVADQFVA